MQSKAGSPTNKTTKIDREEVRYIDRQTYGWIDRQTQIDTEQDR